MPGPEMGKFDRISWKMVASKKWYHMCRKLPLKMGWVWMGFSAAFQNQSQERLLKLPCNFSKKIKKHVMWRTCVTLGSQSWWVGVIADHAICMSICRFVGSSRSYPLIMVIANDWLPPRQKSLPHDSAWVLVDIHCLCIFGWPASRVEIQFFFGNGGWNPSTIKSWCWGISFLKIKIAVLALLGFSPICLGNFEKTDLEGRDLPLIFGQSLVGH